MLGRRLSIPGATVGCRTTLRLLTRNGTLHSGPLRNYGSFDFTPMRKLIKLILFLLMALPLSAKCVRPRITSGPTGVSDATGTQLTVTWTTNIASDTMLVYGIGNAGTPTPVTDTNGVLNHSVTVTGLIPGKTEVWAGSSQAIVNGVACGTGYRKSIGQTSTVMAPPPAGPLTYGIKVTGPTYVTQGYRMFFRIEPYVITGAYTDYSMKITLTGLPAFTTVGWSDKDIWGYDGGVESNTQGVNYDTMSIRVDTPFQKEPYLTTNVGGTTPPGNYTITITGAGTGVPTVVTTWPLHVVSSSAPFSGVAFPYGTPTSYPSVPGLATYTASADTYGQQTCAQDQDLTNRIIRPNDQANLTPVAVCCTYASWFYDGAQVYQNVEDFLHNGRNWLQCRQNVYQVYAPYVLGASFGAATSYLGFSKGYYTDFLKGGAAAGGTANDLAILNAMATKGYPSPSTGSWVGIGYLQRETAYALRNEIHAVAVGINQPLQGKSSTFIRDYALDHVLGQLDQACLTQNADYYEYFMFGLQAEELVEYYKLAAQDPRIPPAIRCIADWIYPSQWDTIGESFPYDKAYYVFGYTQKDFDGSCMATLNNLISPMYAFVFRLSGNSSYQIKGDDIFNNGALFAGCTPPDPHNYLAFPSDSNGKAYSQQYLWGTDYVNWRSGAPVNTTYTVKPSGGDFTTISACAAAAVAGDTCLIYAGSYAGWTQSTNGSATLPITFIANTGDTVTVTSGINVSSRSYIVISGLTLNGTVTGSGSTNHVTVTH